MEELRVLVVSGDPLARAGLALLLGGQEGITVSGQVAPEEDWPGPDPDAVLWDLGIGLRLGLEELRSLEGLPVVAIVADEADAREALAVALRAAALGLVVLDEAFVPISAPAEPPAELTEPLTPRELEVLQRLTQGLSNKQIAQRLG
jgi:two-component system nitrate/nitrite response regulator NarL